MYGGAESGRVLSKGQRKAGVKGGEQCGQKTAMLVFGTPGHLGRGIEGAPVWRVGEGGTEDVLAKAPPL